MPLKINEAISKGEFIPLKAHASTKKFYSGMWEGERILLIVFELGIQERDNFLELTNLLNQNGISAPKIIHLPQSEPYLITQFVNGKLLSQESCNEEIFSKILLEAQKFSKIIPPFSVPALDRRRLAYEMDFFLLHFCKTFVNSDVDEDVRRELHNFADEIDRFAKSFCHRDYHSENIIVKGNEIFVLDYQDALFAPRTYDFGSLYVDGYYDFSREERAKIKNFAISLFGATEKEFLQTALQRALKALGTFGFQIVYRKKAKYIDSIKRTTRYLEELISCKTLEYEKSREYLKEIQNKITSELCG